MNKIIQIIFLLLISIITLEILVNNKYINTKYIELNENYIKIQKHLNLTFNSSIYSLIIENIYFFYFSFINKKIKKKIKIGIYTLGLSDAGMQRSTSLMINSFYKIKIFDIYLFTINNKEENEYLIPKYIKRFVIKNYDINILIKQIKKNMIDILIYQFPLYDQMKKLNNLKNIKIIFYIHQCFLYWFYKDYILFKLLYKVYQNLKYIISLVPFENDYLFKKWGIRSILMDNFITYQYNLVIPSDLSSKTILMIGRANDILKRFDLGIKAMKYIIREIPECEMKIISKIIGLDNLNILINNLNLEKNINFVGYSSTPEIYFKNSSLHIFPSISECFPMVLSETKIFGIPNVLVGIDYVSISKGGTIIIYDDSPKSIAKESIAILKNNKYKKILSKEAKASMKRFKNNLLLKKWVKLILSIYNGDLFYKNMIEEEIKIPKNDSINIIKKQIDLLKIRNKKFEIITNYFLLENFTFIENIDI